MANWMSCRFLDHRRPCVITHTTRSSEVGFADQSSRPCAHLVSSPRSAG